jgi:uncharacterized protein
LIIVDTSGVLSAIDPRQAQHIAAVEVLRQPQIRLLSPFVLAELDYLITSHGGQAQALRFLADVESGAYQLEPFDATDVAAASEVMRRYSDQQIRLADASLVVLAQRHQCWDVLTLDQRHFRVLRGSGATAFRLLPSDH